MWTSCVLCCDVDNLILTVTATDVDSVTNSQLTYSVTDNSFTVQTLNNIGYIKTARYSLYLSISTTTTTTSDQRMSTKGRIAVLSPAAANGFVRPWPRLINGSLGPHDSAHKRHLDRFSLFRRTRVTNRHRQTDWQTDHGTSFVAISRYRLDLIIIIIIIIITKSRIS